MGAEELRWDNLQKHGLLLFEAVSGSQAYGLALPHSDLDIKGVFVLPREMYYGLNYIPQLSNPTNDIVYYEVGRFMELLSRNNPTMLELLGTPEECVRYRHALWDKIKPELFLSKLCKETFAGYAAAQIKKARGLNKKITNPMPRERKGVLDFCYVPRKQGAVPVLEWLSENGWSQEHCALVNIPHMPGLFHLFYDENGADLVLRLGYKGIVQGEQSNQVSLSAVPKDAQPAAVMSFNKDGYTKYCTDYRDYWAWVEKRNEARYAGNVAHGRNYDAKNMMHTFRLLDMAAEIGEQGRVLVRRPNREELLRIRAGEYSYEELLARAEARLGGIEDIYRQSPLPAEPALSIITTLLVEIRMAFYGG